MFDTNPFTNTPGYSSTGRFNVPAGIPLDPFGRPTVISSPKEEPEPDKKKAIEDPETKEKASEPIQEPPKPKSKKSAINSPDVEDAEIVEEQEEKEPQIFKINIKPIDK